MRRSSHLRDGAVVGNEVVTEVGPAILLTNAFSDIFGYILRINLAKQEATLNVFEAFGKRDYSCASSTPR